MAETLLQKIKDEARSYVTAPVFPFLQPTWPKRMWLFAVLAYVR